MALPKKISPTYSLTIPSNKKKIKYRAFTVKEQSNLLIANDTEDAGVMYNTLVDLIKSCVQDTNLDVEKLAIFDIEYIFTRLTSVSSNSVSRIKLNCPHCPETEEKAHVVAEIDLEKLEVKFPENSSNKIPLYEDIGIVLKYPTFDIADSLEAGGSDVQVLFNIIENSVDFIYEGNEIHRPEDYTKEELVEFLSNLTTAHLEKISQFFMNQPQLSIDVNYVCPVCQANNDITLKGIKNFF